MKLWRWLAQNSSALQGAAAVLVLISAFVAAPAVIWRSLKPDLVIEVDPDQGTVPPELLEWVRDVQSELVEALEDLPKVKKESWQKLRDLTASMSNERLAALYGVGDTIARLRLEVRNQTDRVISGVRISLDHIYRIWSISAKGTFLTNEETQNFIGKVKPARSTSRLVLPELPPLPPRSSLEVILYGSVENADVEVSAQGATTKVERIVEVENTWLVDWYMNPYKAFPLFLFLFLALWLAVFPAERIWKRVLTRVVRKATPGIIYNLACKEALANRGDQAMLFLRKAFDEGYKDKVHAKNDPDLTILRGRDDFKDLVVE